MAIGYKIEFSRQALKALKKLDPPTAFMIFGWIDKTLRGTADPRAHGRQMKGEYNQYWRYRVGNYRILAKIQDDKLLVFVIAVGHRREIYK